MDKQQTKTQNINDLKEVLIQYKNDCFKGEFDRVNSFIVRFHRLVLDGSYFGEEWYKTQVRKVRSIKTESGYNAIVRTNLNGLIRHEFDGLLLSNKEFDRIAVETIGEELFNKLMEDLKENVKDFKEDHE